MRNVIIYVVLINVAAFLMYGLDKEKAKRKKWRISEAALLGVAAAGGSVGAFVGMHVFHHKTRKAKFRFGIPLIFLLQAVALLFATGNAAHLSDLVKWLQAA